LQRHPDRITGLVFDTGFWILENPASCPSCDPINFCTEYNDILNKDIPLLKEHPEPRQYPGNRYGKVTVQDEPGPGCIKFRIFFAKKITVNKKKKTGGVWLIQ